MKVIKNEHKNICQFIVNKKLYDAFDSLLELINDYQIPKFENEINNYKETYNYLLEYTFKGVNDPQRAEIYRKLQKSLLGLNDKIKDIITIENPKDNFQLEKKYFYDSPIAHTHTVTKHINEIISISTDSENEERKENLNNLFKHLLYSNDFVEEDVDILKKYSLNKKLFTHEKSLIVSAITISLLNNFSENKFYTLLNFYDTNEENSANRAFIGIVLAFYKYDDRISLYKKIINRTSSLSDDSNTKKFIRDIIFQLIRTKETDEISEKLKNEIIPEMAKLQPKIEEKLDLDNIISDSLIEDKNPEWEEVFEDSPDLLNKMEEMSKLQLEGSDVFMSAFAMLKHFPFFNELSNWFLPFYKNNTDALSAFDNNDDSFDADTFLTGLQNSSYMCNSDKYSFCMNIKMMPDAQKKMIVNLFKMEIEAMGEISKEDEILDKNVKDKHIFTTYIQDLYRFFKLHPWKSSFDDIFDYNLDIESTTFYKILINDEKLLKDIADFYFEKSYWNNATKTYLELESKGENSRNIFEKTAFSFQKMKDYEKALKYYKRAELYTDTSLWLTKKTAFCYRKLNNFEKALEYYLKAETEQPENLHIQANIGHCLLSQEKHDEALKYYYKVEYFNPENTLVMRPLAWCSFVLGKLDAAEKYYIKLIEKKPSAFDFINYGHVLFCKNMHTEAINQYIKAAEIVGIAKFSETLTDDSPFLIKNGVENTVFALIIDYVKSKLKKD